MDSEVEQYLRETQEKQDYLKKEIVDKGYDTIQFATYLSEKKGNRKCYDHEYFREWN